MLLLQEHKLDARGARDATMAARLMGLEARFDARADGSASRGTAIIVKPANLGGLSREKVTFKGGEDGTITTAVIVTPERTFDVACVYLPSQPQERVTTIDNIIKKRLAQ